MSVGSISQNHQATVIYGANVLNDNISILKFWFSSFSGGWKGKKNAPKMLKVSVCYTLYFRNHILYDLHLWYKCMYKRLISPGLFSFFFFFFKNFFIQNPYTGEVKVCLTQYLRNCTSYHCDFWSTCAKWWYLQVFFFFFFFFLILILGFLAG